MAQSRNGTFPSESAVFLCPCQRILSPLRLENPSLGKPPLQGETSHLSPLDRADYWNGDAYKHIESGIKSGIKSDPPLVDLYGHMPHIEVRQEPTTNGGSMKRKPLPQKKATLAGLNAAMKKEGINATLYKGNGYFYFISPEYIDVPSIYIFALHQVTHDEMMEHIRDSWKVAR